MEKLEKSPGKKASEDERSDDIAWVMRSGINSTVTDEEGPKNRGACFSPIQFEEEYGDGDVVPSVSGGEGTPAGSGRRFSQEDFAGGHNSNSGNHFMRSGAMHGLFERASDSGISDQKEKAEQNQKEPLPESTENHEGESTEKEGDLKKIKTGDDRHEKIKKGIDADLIDEIE